MTGNMIRGLCEKVDRLEAQMVDQGIGQGPSQHLVNQSMGGQSSASNGLPMTMTRTMHREMMSAIEALSAKADTLVSKVEAVTRGSDAVEARVETGTSPSILGTTAGMTAGTNIPPSYVLVPVTNSIAGSRNAFATATMATVERGAHTSNPAPSTVDSTSAQRDQRHGHQHHRSQQPAARQIPVVPHRNAFAMAAAAATEHRLQNGHQQHPVQSGQAQQPQGSPTRRPRRHHRGQGRGSNVRRGQGRVDMFGPPPSTPPNLPLPPIPVGRGGHDSGDHLPGGSLPLNHGQCGDVDREDAEDSQLSPLLNNDVGHVSAQSPLPPASASSDTLPNPLRQL